MTEWSSDPTLQDWMTPAEKERFLELDKKRKVLDELWRRPGYYHVLHELSMVSLEMVGIEIAAQKRKEASE